MAPDLVPVDSMPFDLATRAGAVIVDERDPRVVRRADAEPTIQAPASAERAATHQASEIEVRDVRGGPAAWIGSIGRRLARFERDGRPFAVVLVEAPSVARLLRHGRSVEAAELERDVEGALAGELHDAQALPTSGPPGAHPGSLTREAPGRYWLLVAETDGVAAQALTVRLAGAVAAARLSPPVEVVVGAAVCPEDGHDAAALAAHADIELLAARRSTRGVRPPRSAALDEPGLL